MPYFRSKDVVLAALASLSMGKTADAGKLLLKASAMPDFKPMIEAMNAEQVKASAAKPSQTTALASIVEAMSDVNDIDDLLEDLDYEPGDDTDPEDVAVDNPGAAGAVDTDVEDETGPEQAATAAVLEAASARLQRAQRNLARRSKK